MINVTAGPPTIASVAEFGRNIITTCDRHAATEPKHRDSGDFVNVKDADISDTVLPADCNC